MRSAIANVAYRAILAFEAMLAPVIARAHREMRREEPKPLVMAAVPAEALETQSADGITRDAGSRPSLAMLQAQAAYQIDAAEHALNRIIAECAAIAILPMKPTVELLRELPQRAVAKRTRPTRAA